MLLPTSDNSSELRITYDALQRLVSGGTVALPETYTYDAEGNRLASHLSAAHVTDAGGREVTAYVHDDPDTLMAFGTVSN